jgi:hypothetical protein
MTAGTEENPGEAQARRLESVYEQLPPCFDMACRSSGMGDNNP